MKGKIKFYKDKIALNLLARDVKNASDINDTLEGHEIIGVLSDRFDKVEDGVKYVNEMLKYVSAVSVGLGNGNPNQWEMAAEIAKETDSGHVNQVFPTAGYTQGLLEGSGANNTLVNALISPTGTVGKVIISTGPFSSKNNIVVDIDDALLMLKDCKIKSVKFYNIHGLKHIKELKEVAKACVRNGIPVIEPTGGIDLSNIYEIVRVCVEAKCEKIIPHVYSSAVDKKTGLTDLNIVKNLYDEIKRVV
ncbi:oxo-acid lyase [Acidilutibacter cellobiosedens]|jgi:2-dehydro-3-deoxy-phosphogluconate aldolase|uniref:Oxo-acid lyase n=1 Tax=Acidilutibacter cellobiosedens TaxID=2507161 RepID=A0A410Q912_9FIRM|nr:KDGP aldolase [Acidilutibacter cellobiosedens]QAT60460.1 oxo-acid lyase [Acidilutibacter cellobiosedens]